LDPTLPDVGAGLMTLYYVVGLEDRAPKRPASQVHLAGPFYRGDANALEAEVRKSGAHVWDLPDSGIGFFHLAAVHDWATLNRLYDERPVPPQQLCFRDLEAAQAMVPA